MMQVISIDFFQASVTKIIFQNLKADGSDVQISLGSLW